MACKQFCKCGDLDKFIGYREAGYLLHEWLARKMLAEMSHPLVITTAGIGMQPNWETKPRVTFLCWIKFVIQRYPGGISSVVVWRARWLGIYKPLCDYMHAGDHVVNPTYYHV